ncbi:MAG TPA: hypothetical protein VM285_06330 [Polyangia bacterium]|nr:hypothetical protein [Polyangia bacterium]
MILPQRLDDALLGTLRYCRRCSEWWPEDAEFFGVTVGRDGYRHSWCRACKNSRKGAAARVHEGV